MASSDMQGAMSRAKDVARTELWPIPALGVSLAVVLGVLLPHLDARVDEALPQGLRGYLFGGDADAARTVLNAVAGALITVTSLTFSLTVVTLQLASSQFSPRLLRTFTRERFVHVTLALFLATFVYPLTVLRLVRTAQEEEQAAFVPRISVTLAFVLAVISVLALVLFLAHLAREIRVESMLLNVRTDAVRALERQVPADGHGQQPPAATDGAVLVPASDSGFLVEVDEGCLLRAALENDAVVVIRRQPGAFLVAGTPIGFCRPLTADRFEPQEQERMVAAAQQAVLIGFERTAAQDVGFGLRQLTDVTVKALSPGINDPTTAVHALGHASALLCRMAGHDLGPRFLRDEHGAVRVVLERPDLGEMLDVAVGQPRRYGAGEPAVLDRLAVLLREVAWAVTDEGDRAAVRAQLHRLRATIEAQDLDAGERVDLDTSVGNVALALEGRWPASS